MFVKSQTKQSIALFQGELDSLVSIILHKL